MCYCIFCKYEIPISLFLIRTLSESEFNSVGNKMDIEEYENNFA